MLSPQSSRPSSTAYSFFRRPSHLPRRTMRVWWRMFDAMAVPAWFLNARVLLESENDGSIRLRDPSSGVSRTVQVDPGQGALTTTLVLERAAEYWAKRELREHGRTLDLPDDFGSSYWRSPSAAVSALTGDDPVLIAAIVRHLGDLYASDLPLDEVAEAFRINS